MSDSSSLDYPELQRLPSLPADGVPSKPQYVVRPTGEETSLYSVDGQIVSQIWFKSQPLQLQTIKLIKGIQLYAETHDQGAVGDASQGNWTWLEIVILEDAAAERPRSKDGVELVWRSHRNRFQETSYDWKEGDVFGRYDDLLRLLEEGNVLAVRICARFRGMGIYAKGGYLLFEIAEKPVEREPLGFGGIVSDIKSIHETIREVNLSTRAAFLPKLPVTLFRADVLSNGDDRPARVLSLDGGGVRGLASLHLLKAVMEKAAPNKKPHEVFDMIGGTSTGGLIAIMLGRLKMTIDQCIDKYTDIMKDVFKSGFFGKEGHFLRKGVFYDAKILETKIKDVIRETLNADPEVVPLHTEDHSCRIFCMAVRRDAGNNHGPVFLRSYKNPQEISLLPDIKLWEAARATSAAPAYFDPIKVGNYELVDGGLQANNPLGWLWTEALGVFGPARATSCFLSIGTGIEENIAVPKPGRLPSHDVEAGFAATATNTQITHILFKALLNAFAPQAQGKKYWRLNIGTEIPEHLVGDKVVLDNYEPVGELDDVAAVKTLVEKAKKYIEEQQPTIDECAKALSSHLE